MTKDRRLLIDGSPLPSGSLAPEDGATAETRAGNGVVATACRRSEARVLVIDDEPPVVRMIERILRHEGYTNVRGLSDACRALEVFEEYRPDLVLLDLLMPGLSGYAVLEQFRARMLEVPSPIIVLTSDPSAEARQRALSLGALDFLNKPIDRIEVLLRIANILEVRYFQLRQHAEKVLLEEKVRERTNELEGAQLELLDRLARAAEEFHVGNLYLNRKCTPALVGAHPFGGFNMSGTDSKAGGKDYLLLFTQAKSIATKL